MPLQQGRICPICFKENLCYLGDHLRQVHQLSRSKKKHWFQLAKFCSLSPQESPSEISHQETRPYENFKFHHIFRMIIVDPTECGKTYFVEQLLTRPCLKYPTQKPRKISWFYSQWQPCYQRLQSKLGKTIAFAQGLPDLSDDLKEINPKRNNLLVFDDLMNQAIDSPIKAVYSRKTSECKCHPIATLHVSQRKIQHRHLT